MAVRILGFLVDDVLPWLYVLTYLALAVDVLLFAPLLIFRRLRIAGSLGIFFSSFAFGITLWCVGLIATWYLWGGWAVLVGLFLFGVGVVPIGIVAALFAGEWSLLANMGIMALLTYGTRMLGAWVAERAEERDAELY